MFDARFFWGDIDGGAPSLRKAHRKPTPQLEVPYDRV